MIIIYFDDFRSDEAISGLLLDVDVVGFRSFGNVDCCNSMEVIILQLNNSTQFNVNTSCCESVYSETTQRKHE